MKTKQKKNTNSKALAKAHTVRKSVVKNIMFTQELAPFKAWFDEEWSKGGRQIAGLLKLGKEQFPDLTIPSQPTMDRYVKKYYEPKTVTLQQTGIDWSVSVNKLNEIDFLSDLAIEARRVYDEIVVFDRTQNENKKKKTPPLRGSGAGSWYERARQTAVELNEIKRKMQLYGATGPDNVTLIQNNNINSGNTIIMDKQRQSEILEDRDGIDGWKERVRADRARYTAGAEVG